ncbi:MAG: 16S rRNA (uracil(1498)-N(3))-methyltransferase [Lachnospiraceae bacterium]|nr:16S rRNA (uracil(1498)-N(3))-methyltransferase [Lachnospiraceae bacterium]
MTHIIVESSDIADGTLRITGKDYNHIRNVLRMRPGEEISVSCGDGKEYRFGITSFEEEAVLCKLRFIKEKDAELPVQVTLFQGLPKADKMDLIVQKAVELGVYEIVPVECRRTIVKLDEAKKKKRVERWQTIAESAAEQSHRSIVPKVRMPVTMEEAIGLAKDSTQYRFIPYELQGQEGTRALMEEIEEGSAVSVFIGPEGGFEEDEVALAQEAGIRPVSLGRRILRTETAALTFLSWLIYRFEV